MSPKPDMESLRQLQGDIEAFLGSLEHPIIVEDGIELFDLTAAEWRLRIEFGKLLFEAWSPARSVARRVEEVAYRDRAQMGLFVRKPSARETATLEFRDLSRLDRVARSAGRTTYREQLVAMLGREFAGWRFERVSNRSDREHSFSAWYPRGCARRGTTAWAFLGLSDQESPAAADAALAFGLIWLDGLRGRAEGATVSGLKLFLPPPAVELTAHRAAHLNPGALRLEIFEWCPGQDHPRSVDLRDFGNVQTHLVMRRQSEALVERHRERIQALLGELAERVDVMADSSGSFLSLRILGLEIARVEGLLAPKIFFGLEGGFRPLDPGRPEEFRDFAARVLDVRKAQTRDRSHQFYRLQAERWLERVLAHDIAKIDPALVPESVYHQVPAFSAHDRGVIDILSVTRDGRLAVIELKLTEEINLPMQGLDYWLRVKWLHDRGQFQPAGYFTRLSLAPGWPRLYLVSPAFRFHSTTGRLIQFFAPGIEVIQVGLNDHWRKNVKVLFRRELGARG